MVVITTSTNTITNMSLDMATGHLVAAGLALIFTSGIVRGIVPERPTRQMDAGAVLAGLLSALFVIAGLSGMGG